MGTHMRNLGRWRQRSQEFKVSLSYSETTIERNTTDLVFAWCWATPGSERPAGGARMESATKQQQAPACRRTISCGADQRTATHEKAY